MNGAIFIKHLCRCLVPTLRPGDIVIIDNLLAHKRQEVRELIEAAGAQLRYLPPYSPDLNPIEHAFAKLKAHLRKAKQRTIPALYDRFEPTAPRRQSRAAGSARPATGFHPGARAELRNL